MGGVKGVKESVELGIAIIDIGFEVKKALEDGAQLSDLAVLFQKYQNDPLLKAHVDAGVAGAGEVVAEVSELDLQDGIKLAMDLGAYAVAKLAAAGIISGVPKKA